MSTDDEIEILDKRTDPSVSGNNDVCQLCRTNLSNLSSPARDKHYDLVHKQSGTSTERPKHDKRTKRGSTSACQRKTAPKKSGVNTEQEDFFWHPEMTAASPPGNYSPGVLSILKEALKISHRKGNTKRAVLCYERTPHIYRETFDANWGCGYRNFLMACAALMAQPHQDLYFANLDTPITPGVRNLQRWIENAWECGYDEIGALELHRKLVNTKQRIGTSELYVAFTSRKIPCVLVDFDLRGCEKGFDLVADWIANYFIPKPSGDVNTILRAQSPVVATDKMPVVLQYDGHSVTIVGYELGKNGKLNLLVFDPSKKVDKDVRLAGLNELDKDNRPGRPESPSPNKRSRTNQDVVSILSSDDDQANGAKRPVTRKTDLDPETVIKAFRFKPKKKNEYQVLYFTMGALLTEQEQLDRKVVFSECER